jgi:hypothetical protein
LFRRWLTEEQVRAQLALLDGDRTAYDELPPESQRGIMDATRGLGGSLDNASRSWGWKSLELKWEELEKVKAILNQYKWDMEYTIENGTIKFEYEDWKTLPSGAPMPKWLYPEWDPRRIIQVALTQLYTTEADGWADKYHWLNSRSVPWCAGFVNWVLKESWFQWTNSNLAKSFIDWSWYGHVALLVKWPDWDYYNLWGNQWGAKMGGWAVTLSKANVDRMVWYAEPQQGGGLKKVPGRGANADSLPEVCIAVYDRTPTKSNS